MTELNADQKQAIKKWVHEGCGLSEIQRRLASEYKLMLTYMDVRFLLIDLGLDLKDDKSKSTRGPVALGTPGKAAAGPAHPAAEENLLEDLGEEPATSGGVTVDIDRVTSSGALASGTVKLSDGMAAKWSLDQLGRLALQAKKPNYRPSQQDVQEFQMVLSRKLQAQGY